VLLDNAVSVAVTAPKAHVKTVAKIPHHFRYFDIAQYRFWIADGSALLTTGFRLSDESFEKNTFINFVGCLSIQNLKPVVSLIEPSKSKII